MPRVRQTTFLAPLPAPNTYSPRVIALTSLSIFTFKPNLFSNIDLRGVFSHPFIFGKYRTMPLLESVGPGTPIPTPARFFLAMPDSPIIPSMLSTRESMTLFFFALTGVLI